MAFDGYFPKPKVIPNRPVSRPRTPPKPTERAWRNPNRPKAPQPNKPPYPRNGGRPRPLTPPTPPPGPLPKPSVPIGPPPSPAVPVPGGGQISVKNPNFIQIGRFLVPKAARLNPWWNAAALALDIWNATRDVLPPGVGLPRADSWILPPGRSSCGSLQGVVVRYPLEGSPGSTYCASLPLNGQGFPNPNNISARGFMFFEPYQIAGGQPRAVVNAVAWPQAGQPGGPGPWPQPVNPGLIRAHDPFAPPVNELPRLPMRLTHYQPSAPDFRLGRTASNGERQGFVGWGNRWDVPFEPGYGGSPGNPGPNPHKPPPPGTKEKKGKAPTWFGGLIKSAWEATEAVDLAENLFDCLSKKTRDAAPKTGRTTNSAFIGAGHAYRSAYDKGKAVYDNINDLDLDCAMRKVSCNHIMDMLLGRFFGIADAGARRGGINGIGIATRDQVGRLDQDSVDRFNKWISDHPEIDNLVKSLDCENLGRS